LSKTLSLPENSFLTSGEQKEPTRNDALFSRTEIDRRFRDGYAAMRYRLEMDPPLWKLEELSADSLTRPDAGVVIHLF
jgi:hypothetical protein